MSELSGKWLTASLKRIFDFLLSSLGMILFLPGGLFFSFLVKCGDGGAIFYTQERWGKKGERFEAYKFRTMADGRVTWVGRFLRATAMDELPQLINIWKGDMSFVGPRALASKELDPSFPNFAERHQIRPGLTGPAQVYAPRNIPLEEKFRYDLDYIRTRSLGGDLKLLFLSLWVTLRGKWESREKKI